MATVTQLWPSSTDHAAVGSGELTNPTNASVDDASTFATKAVSAAGTWGSKYGTFGLSIPAGATITQVQIKYQGKKDTGTELVAGHIFWSVGATDGTSHNQNQTTTLTYRTYDVTAERAWVPSDFADGTFFLTLEGVWPGAGTSTTLSVNALYVIVTYTVASSAHGLTTVGAG